MLLVFTYLQYGALIEIKILRFTEGLNKTNVSKVGENTGFRGYFYLKTILPF